MLEYTHTPLGEEVRALAGSYWKTEEGRLAFRGREVLYLIGSTSEICGCCGSCPSFQYIKVPGYIKNWQHRINERGLPVSMVEPIRSVEEQREIARILQEKYQLSQVEFW